MERSRSGEGTACHLARNLHGSSSQLAATHGVQARRLFLKSALVIGLGLPVVGQALGEESPAASERPRDGDRFVDAQRSGAELKPGDLPLDGPPVFAWPKDPKSGVVRDGSRLNQVLLLRLDPASLDADTRGHAANGSLAYSAICTHVQCPVQGWIKERYVLKCYCHDSEFDPRANGKVVFGPAPRNLPALPVRIDGNLLVAAGPFTGRVGAPNV